jgi:hypothetical protein
MDNNFVISLTTIPSRINTIEPVIESLLNQRYPPKTIYLNLPKKYNRFDTKIEIPDFLKKYKKVKIFYMDADYGPATKFIGALINPEISNNDVVVVTDDDIVKQTHWAETLMSQYDKNRITSFVEKKLGNEIIWGYLGYAFRKNIFDIDDMMEFYNKVKCKCYLVDDHWLTGYCHYKKINIHNISIETNKYINKSEIEDNHDALVKLSGSNNRRKVSENCRDEIKKQFDSEFPFWCCMGCCVNGERKIETFDAKQKDSNDITHNTCSNNMYFLYFCMVCMLVVVICVTGITHNAYLVMLILFLLFVHYKTSMIH